MHTYSSSNICTSVDAGYSVSSLRILCGEQVAIADWWGICESDPEATFFATPLWTSLLTEAFSCFQSKPFSFSFDGRACCLVPAIEVRRLCGRTTALHSMPFGTYGGLVGRSNLGPDEVNVVLRILTRGVPKRFQTTVYPNPLGSPLPQAFTTDSSRVHAPDLSDGWDSWWRGLDEKTRYHTEKAQRRGVEIRSRLDADALETFYNHYARTARSWPTGKLFGPRFFRAVWRYRSSGIELWTAHREGVMMAGLLVFRFRSQAAVFLSFVRPETRPLAPQNLIYSRLIRHACDSRCTYLNFLGSNGSLGVESFKQSIGGKIREFRYVNMRSPLYRLVSDPISRMRNRSDQLIRAARGMSGVQPIDLQR